MFSRLQKLLRPHVTVFKSFSPVHMYSCRFKNAHETRSDHALEERQARKNMHPQRHSTKYQALARAGRIKKHFFADASCQAVLRLQLVLTVTRESERYSSASLYTWANLALQYITECMI